MGSTRLMFLLPLFGLLFLTILQQSFGQSSAPSPAPSPSSDGSAIDQGVAYVLLMVALAITYLVH